MLEFYPFIYFTLEKRRFAMTELKFNILKTFYKAYPLREVSLEDIMNSFSQNPIDTKNALDELCSLEYINLLRGSKTYKLTSLGATRYEMEKQQKEIARKQAYRQIITLVASVLGVLISLIQLFK